MDTTHAIRLSKVALVFFAGAWAALVTFGNITDPMSNYRFVEHVLAMDTTFGSDALMGRALESPVYAKLAFGLIVLSEAFMAVSCLFGSARLFLARKGTDTEFHGAKAPAIWGLLAGLSLFFFGFQVVGGEWFASWQSETWNGLDSASRSTLFLFGSLIFLSLPND